MRGQVDCGTRRHAPIIVSIKAPQKRVCHRLPVEVHIAVVGQNQYQDRQYHARRGDRRSEKLGWGVGAAVSEVLR